MTIRTRTRSILLCAVIGVIGSCKGSTPPPPPQGGPPSALVQISATPTARANTEVTTIQISVRDADDVPVAGHTVNFTVTAGSGCFPTTGGACGSTASATSDANGTVTVPPWRLGKSVVEQKVQATLGSITLELTAVVQSAYSIEVRFWGGPMTDAQKAFFVTAAARLRGIVIGDIPDIQASNFDLAFCGVIGEPPLDQLIDDVIIYASIDSIDHTGDGTTNKIAQAGPCAGAVRGNGWHTAVGVMQFDSLDISGLATSGRLQDVITHEMMHVLGFGVFWDAEPPSGRNIMTGQGTGDQGVPGGDPRYTGAQGRQGCVTAGGTSTCASSVPLENAFGPGSNDSHWREATFVREMMTSILNTGLNPISVMTVKSFSDIGFIVNDADFDAYTVPAGSALLANAIPGASPGGQWEEVLQPRVALEPDGRIRILRPRK